MNEFVTKMKYPEIWLPSATAIAAAKWPRGPSRFSPQINAPMNALSRKNANIPSIASVCPITPLADFSKYAGGVIGQTLAMEGMFAFFLESAFVGALIWGEKRLGPRGHFAAALAVALGSWISGYFILVTNSFMQHPVGYQIEPNGSLGIASMSAYLLNPWAFVQFAHNQLAAVVTGSFVVAAIGAFYALRDLHPVQARLYLRAGTFVGLIASLLVAFPTGDQQAKMVGNHQPITLAAMEGKFEGGPM